MSEWTTDTLHEHMCRLFELTKTDLDDRFESQKEATERALASAQLAVDKAERLAEIRAETQDKLANERARAQNEWRASLSDMTATYLTVSQYDTAHGVLVEKLNSLQQRHDADLAVVREAIGVKTGRQLGQGQLIIWLFLAVASFVSLLGIILDLTVRH